MYAPKSEIGKLCPTILRMNKEATIAFFTWVNAIAAVENGKPDNDEGNRVAKYHTNVARFALLFQVMKWACDGISLNFIDKESVRSTIKLNEYFENSIRRVKLSMGEAMSSSPAKENVVPT